MTILLIKYNSLSQGNICRNIVKHMTANSHFHGNFSSFAIFPFSIDSRIGQLYEYIFSFHSFLSLNQFYSEEKRIYWVWVIKEHFLTSNCYRLNTFSSHLKSAMKSRLLYFRSENNFWELLENTCQAFNRLFMTLGWKKLKWFTLDK